MGIGRAWAGLLLGVLLSGCIPDANVRTNEPPPQPARVVTTPPPANAGFHASELADCRASNRQDHADLVRRYQEADRAGRINPAERRRFGEMVERLRRHEAALRANGLSLGECRQLAGLIAQERDVLAGMTRHDPGVAQCRRDNQRNHAEVVRMYQDADRAGRINPAERLQFNEMVERLRRHEAALRSDGLSLDDCRRLSGHIAQEREVVAGMARHDPGVVQCRRDNQRAHAGVVRSFQEADRAGQISRAERRRFDEIVARMRDHEASLRANGLTLEECQRLGRVIAAEGREVQRMAQQPQ